MFKPSNILAFLAICGICLTQGSASSSSSGPASSSVTLAPENMGDIITLIQMILSAKGRKSSLTYIPRTNLNLLSDDLDKAYPRVRLYVICSNFPQVQWDKSYGFLKDNSGGIDEGISANHMNLKQFWQWLNNYNIAEKVDGFRNPIQRIIVEVGDSGDTGFQTAILRGNGVPMTPFIRHLHELPLGSVSHLPEPPLPPPAEAPTPPASPRNIVPLPVSSSSSMGRASSTDSFESAVSASSSMPSLEPIPMPRTFSA